MKPNTYTQLIIHIVFAVKYRQSLLVQPYKDEICKYASGIVDNKNCKYHIINGHLDHLHVLAGLNPNISISDLVRDIKRSTSLFINERRWFYGRFAWQEGYSAFSVRFEDLPRIYQYILNQEEHHAKQSFREEYIAHLRENEVPLKKKYLFKFFD